MDRNPDGIFLFFMSENIEIWKDVAGFEGIYQVSCFGRVKSLINYHGTSERILKQSKDRKGYLMVCLKNKGIIQKRFRVHQLVAMAFLGHTPCGHKIVVDHINDVKSDNRLSNLQLISSRENSNKNRGIIANDFIGVYFDKNLNKWRASITFKKRCFYLGGYNEKIDAHNAYQKALKDINDGVDLGTIYLKRVKLSQYKGVSYSKKDNIWKARYKSKYIGCFKTELQAYKATKTYLKRMADGCQ